MNLVSAAAAGFLLALSAGALHAASESDADGNLLRNGDFSAAAKGAPRLWMAGGNAPGQVTHAFESENGFISVKAEDGTDFKAFMQTVAITPEMAGKEMNLEGRIRVNAVDPGSKPWQAAGVVATFFDSAGVLIKPYPKTPKYAEPTAGWTAFSTAVPVPVDAEKLTLQLGLFNAAGDVDFDDLTLRVTEPAD